MFILILLPFPAFGKEGGLELQENSTIILPWATAGIDTHFLVEARPQLEEARIRIIKNITQNSQTLSEIIQASGDKTYISPHDDFFTATHIGASRGEHFSKQIIEPWLCGSDNIYILAMIESDYGTGYHFKIDHVSILKETFKDLVKNNKLGDDINGRFQHILSNLRTRRFDDQTILKIDLNLLSETHGDRLGSNLCLNFLVLQLLQEKFNFVPQGDRENLARLKQVFPKIQVARPNRVMHIEWRRVPTLLSGQTLTTPNEISFNMRISDGVFGRYLPEIYRQKESFKLSDRNNLTLNHLAEVIQFFENEAQVLAKNQNPKIIHINGAWAYLDKGRAWGLNPLDRLVGNEVSKVKGHIIGFYGPEKKLKDANGKSIYEGAIIFIRQGLAELRVGQTFSYDQTQYPR